MPTGTVSEPTTELGARLRELRTEAGWTQSQMAELMNTGANRISDWETGRYEPSLPVLKRFAGAFGVTIAELMEDSPVTTLGARLRNMRIQADWTEREMARFVGTRANRISSWESDLQEPSLSALQSVAQVFGITVAKLLDGVM